MKDKSQELTCPSCAAVGSREIQKRICIRNHMHSKPDILSGSFFEWECPGCKERFFITSPFLYNDSAHQFMVYYIPDFSEREYPIPTLFKTKKEYDTQASTLRIAANYVDFIEKIRIFEAGLSDRVIETVKMLYSKLTLQETNELVYSMVFEHQDDERNLHFAVFLENNDFETVVPLAAYEKTISDFAQLFTKEANDKFVVVDRQWVIDKLSQ